MTAQPARAASKWIVATALVCFPALLISVSSYELWPAGMLAFGDLAAYPDSAGAFVDAFHNAWSDRGLGGPFSTGSGLLFPVLLVALFRGRADLAQHAYMAAWIPVAFAGMVYLCRRWMQCAWGVALAGGVVFVTTPVAIGLVIAGAGGLLWAYALAPFVIATAEKLRAEGFRAVGWFAAALALLSAFSPELLIFGFLVAAIWVMIGPARRRIVPAMAIALTFATIAALPGIFARDQIRPSERLVDKALVDFGYTYDKVSLPSLLRLAGNQGDPMDALGYNEAAAWTFVGFLPCFLLMVGLVRRRKGHTLPLRVTALVGVAIIALLGLAFLADKRVDLFEHVPALLAFRNPEKLMILLAAGLVAGGMYGAHCVLKGSRKRRSLVRPIALAGLGLYLVLYAQPAFSGHWGVKSVRGSSYVMNEELIAAARFLQRSDPSLPGKWRIAWVPFSSTDVLSLEWVRPEWANDPVLESRDPEIEDASGAVAESLEGADMQSFHRVADLAAVRYIVLRKDAEPEIARAIRTDRKLKRIHRGRGFEVWRNAAALPRIRSFPALTAVVAPRRRHPPRFQSGPMLRLTKSSLARRSLWAVYPRENFAWVGEAMRIRSTTSDFWPVLARRTPVYGGTSYTISALVRTRNAVGAHLKVIWYRSRTDPEHKALRHDHAEPALTGDHAWTRVTAIVKSPYDAKFGELTFLAGKAPLKSRKAAVSWIKDLQIAHYYSGHPPTSKAEILAAIPEFAARNHELADATSLEPFSDRMPDRMILDAVVVNPLHGLKSNVFRGVLRRARSVAVVVQAKVALQPRRGIWRHVGDSVVVVSRQGEASLTLGIVPSGNYALSVVGCQLPIESMEIVTETVTRTPRLSPAASGCGRMRTTKAIPLAGKAMVHFTLPRGASIARVEAMPGTFRRSASTAVSGEMAITAANSPSPALRDFSSVGVTLADAFHPGWRPSGSSAHHFRTLLGFNGFLVDDPQALSGLSYGPQRTRDLLLIMSTVAWLAIIVLLVFAAPERRARLRGRATSRGNPKLPT